MIYSYKFIKTVGEINPLILLRYLENTGWQQYQNNMKNIRVYQLKQGDKLFMINLPLDHDICDYTVEMCDAVETLAAAENKTITQIMLHLLNPYTDVLTVQFSRETDDSFRFSLDDVVQLYTNLKSLLKSAASEVADMENLSSEYAENFLKVCRLSQREDTENYIVSIICPFAETENNGENATLRVDDAKNEDTGYFSRKVIGRIMDNVSEIKRKAAKKEMPDIIKQEQANNISMDFCNALYNLNVDPQQLDTELSVEWSPEEHNMKESSKITLSHDEFQQIGAFTQL